MYLLFLCSVGFYISKDINLECLCHESCIFIEARKYFDLCTLAHPFLLKGTKDHMYICSFKMNFTYMYLFKLLTGRSAMPRTTLESKFIFLFKNP